MENPEEILHSLEEFTKLKPKDIPRELEEYLCFVAKTGDPVYQWAVIKSLFREKLINVITEFYESCPSVDIPPCPNVDLFNYDTMKTFILEKLDTFVAAPFTVQRICELLTTPRKEYNRIDKYMRALEKNILVVSTTEPGNHRTPENGDGFINGIETEHLPEASNEINIEEMDESPVWPKSETVSFQSTSKNEMVIDTFPAKPSSSDAEAANSETVITCCPIDKTYGADYVLEAPETIVQDESPAEAEDVSVTITAIPAPVQKRRDSIEPPNEQEPSSVESKTTEASIVEDKIEESSSEDIIKNKEESVCMTENETSSENDTKLLSTQMGGGDNLTDDFETVKSLPPEIEKTILEPPVPKSVEEEEVIIASAGVQDCKMTVDVPVVEEQEEPKIEDMHAVEPAAPEQVVDEEMKLVEEQQVQDIVVKEEDKKDTAEVIESQTEVEEKPEPVQTEDMDLRIEESPAEKIETREEEEKECEDLQQVSLMDVDPEPTTTIITETTPPPQQEQTSTTNTASAEIVQTETTN